MRPGEVSQGEGNATLTRLLAEAQGGITLNGQRYLLFPRVLTPEEQDVIADYLFGDANAA